MEYIVFDLEFNQGFDKKLNKTVSNERCPFEILQIGAIKLDKSFNIIDTFNSYVKPSIYSDIHPFIKNMTGIDNSKIENAPTFISVYKDFKKFITSKNTILCVWGTGDLKELYRNINFYDLPSNFLPKDYINVQHYASRFFNNPTGKSIGLQNAINILGLSSDKSYHDALNDAYYTAQVFMRIYNPGMVSDTYTYTTVTPNKSSLTTKKQVDYDKLFGEFSKILDRNLSKEDKKIIDIAYKMGKSNKFLVDAPIKKR